jgi:hypothetical protein
VSRSVGLQAMKIFRMIYPACARKVAVRRDNRRGTRQSPRLEAATGGAVEASSWINRSADHRGEIVDEWGNRDGGVSVLEVAAIVAPTGPVAATSRRTQPWEGPKERKQARRVSSAPALALVHACSAARLLALKHRPESRLQRRSAPRP